MWPLAARADSRAGRVYTGWALHDLVSGHNSISLKRSKRGPAISGYRNGEMSFSSTASPPADGTLPALLQTWSAGVTLIVPANNPPNGCGARSDHDNPDRHGQQLIRSVPCLSPLCATGGKLPNRFTLDTGDELHVKASSVADGKTFELSPPIREVTICAI